MTTSFSLYTMFRFGYDAQHTGYLFAYVGVIAVIMQGGLIGRLVKRFGELPLVIVGAFLFAGSLFAVPFVGPQAGGLAGTADRRRNFFDGKLAFDAGVDEPGFEECWTGGTRKRAGSDAVSGEPGAGGWSVARGGVDSQRDRAWRR